MLFENPAWRSLNFAHPPLRGRCAQNADMNPAVNRN